ncbi:MAG: RdgB/HAM1 family non-canonical purine NTP pyrophosphatase [Dehalococcoidia bacterium]|nr:RdgB/HAM1 family non-canonical purine NTP pyrophosphatase [Dehalococcoidia bacterium]
MAGHTTNPDRRIVMATGNAGKVREFRAILGGHGWELLTPAEAGVEIPPVVETGRSYVENAISKAVAIARASGLPAIADDSGIEVDALDGRPGPLSARFGGARCQTDAERTALLLQMLEGVPTARRGARFRAVIALARPGNRAVVREGVLEGRIALAPRGADGFGYDPIFELPDGRTTAEIGEEKHLISHRARALHAMAGALDRLR